MFPNPKQYIFDPLELQPRHQKRLLNMISSLSHEWQAFFIPRVVQFMLLDVAQGDPSILLQSYPDRISSM